MTTHRQQFVLFFLLTLFLLTPFQSTSAQTDSSNFRVSTFVGEDTTPPTTPAPFEAIPIATNQINLSWGSSTDDWVLSGYHVWRDSVQIATTTNTSYADTGLTASTTYTYYVTAYDSFFNESASSTVIATTTLDVPEEEPATATTQGTKVRWSDNELVSLVVLPEKDAVVIRYETNSYIKSVIKWGKGVSYELGSLLEHAYTKFHETRISGLTPGTRYLFTIEGQNRFGQHGELYTGEFSTLPQDDTFPPGNVFNVRAMRSGDDVILSWTNPSDPDFDKVRVMSSELFYPSDTADGWVVYEGGGTGAIEENIVQDGLWRYYTIFSYDALGNISSGAVVRVYLGDDTEPPAEPELDPTQNELSLRLTDIIFTQDGVRLPVESDWSVAINGSKQLHISIPYETLPEHLKTILVVLEDSVDSDKIFKFLLRINSDKTAYTSTVAPLGVSGIFPLQVSVFDFKTAQIGYTQGILVSEILSASRDEAESTPLWLKIVRTFTNSYLLFGILILMVLLYMSRRLMRREW